MSSTQSSADPRGRRLGRGQRRTVVGWSGSAARRSGRPCARPSGGRARDCWVPSTGTSVAAPGVVGSRRYGAWDARQRGRVSRLPGYRAPCAESHGGRGEVRPLLPNCGEFSDVRAVGELACEAEFGGWGGIFLFDAVSPFEPGSCLPLVDPWPALMAIGLATERVRFGVLVTAVARRRPAQLARQSVTLDRASGGRLVVGVGLGYGPAADPEFTGLGERRRGVL